MKTQNQISEGRNPGRYLKKIFFILMVYLTVGIIPSMDICFLRTIAPEICLAQGENETNKNITTEDIQWFRNEMKISSKYLENNEDIMGMSWTHFIAMIFLAGFFITAIAALIVRNRRTKQLFSQLLKENAQDG